MANVYLALRKPMDAIRVYESIEKRRGISDELSMQKIRIYEVLGREAEIRNELQRLIQKFPNEPKYWVFLAELDMRAKKYNEALNNYQKALSLDPVNPYTQLSLIDYYAKINDTTKLFEYMILAFKNPRLNNVDLKIALTLPYYEQKDKAFKLLDAMLSAHPEDPKVLALYAEFLQRDGRYSEAAETYRKVIAIDASQYFIWEALLLSNLFLLDTTALLNDAQEALERFPEQPLVYYMLGTAYNLKAEYLMAMQYLEQAAQLAQSNPNFASQIYGDLGDIYHRLENHAKSDRSYRKALELNPQNVIVLNNFAYYLSLRKEHLNEAEEMARLACQMEPTSPTFLDTFAWVLYQRGKYAEAKAIIEMALQYGGDQEAVLLEHYGDILWKNNEKERALVFWKQAQALDSKDVSEFLNEKITTETLIEN
jgi:tetratricopeptide (TPR) repeat protein